MITAETLPAFRKRYEDAVVAESELSSQLSSANIALSELNQPINSAERDYGMLGSVWNALDGMFDSQLQFKLKYRRERISELESRIRRLKAALQAAQTARHEALEILLHNCPRELQSFLSPFLAARRAKDACELCGRNSRRSQVPFHVHHVRPRAQGGPNNLANVVFICEICHGKQPGTGHKGVATARRNRLKRARER